MAICSCALVTVLSAARADAAPPRPLVLIGLRERGPELVEAVVVERQALEQLAAPRLDLLGVGLLGPDGVAEGLDRPLLQDRRGRVPSWPPPGC